VSTVEAMMRRLGLVVVSKAELANLRRSSRKCAHAHIELTK
jgi:hypothetical protein